MHASPSSTSWWPRARLFTIIGSGALVLTSSTIGMMFGFSGQGLKWMVQTCVTTLCAWLFVVWAICPLINRSRRGKVSVGSLVIAVTATLMSPYFLAARIKANSAICYHNLREIGDAMLKYADQHGGRLPEADRWVKQIKPNLKNHDALHCPEDPVLSHVSYAMNSALSGVNINNEVNDPSNTILIFESNKVGSSPSGGLMDTARRHYFGSVINVLYVDGHARWSHDRPELKDMFRPRIERKHSS